MSIFRGENQKILQGLREGANIPLLFCCSHGNAPAIKPWGCKMWSWEKQRNITAQVKNREYRERQHESFKREIREDDNMSEQLVNLYKQ